MLYSEIDPHSPRGIAYEKAKQMPRHSVKFQGEDGFRTVKYSRGFEGDGLFGEVLVPPTPGYWYETAVQDVTQMTEDKSVGVRVVDTDA